LQSVIQEVEEATKHRKGFFLNLAISYGGRWDIVQAAKKLIASGIDPATLDEKMFSLHLSTNGMPEPDLVIRAGGEKRFSNFLLWQSASFPGSEAPSRAPFLIIASFAAFAASLALAEL